MPDPQYAVLRNEVGEEVSRHRADRMNYDAFTWVYAAEVKQHGPLTVTMESIGMDYETAKRRCHVRSAIRRTSNPSVKYWKNHTIPLDDRVPHSDKSATDWEEYDPRDHEECSEFNETPA